MSDVHDPTFRSLRNELIIIFLALLSVGLLLFEVFADLAPHQIVLIERVDMAIAVIFLLEFLWRLRRADSKLRFFRQSWWELLAAIPITNDMARALRSVRLLRLLQVVRMLRVIRLTARVNVLLDHARVFRQQTQIITVTMTFATVVLCGGLGFHFFEFGINPRVRSFWDSLWWSIVTVTTVGYGDIVPVTAGGRIVAVPLLIIGLAVFGLYTASVATWLIHRRAKSTEPDRDDAR